MTYTPAANYNGPDSFSYTVTDGSTGTSSSVTVNLTVSPVNDVPTATAGSASTTTGSPVMISLAGTDRETCELTFSTPATTAQGGTLSVDQPAGLQRGQPQQRHGQPDLHPAGRLQRPRQLQLHGQRRDRPVGPGDHLDHRRSGGGGSTTTTFPATADAHVYSGQPTTNYGTITTMRTREGAGASSSPIYRSYVRFTISGLAGPVSDVKLRLWVTDASRNAAAGPRGHAPTAGSSRAPAA